MTAQRYGRAASRFRARELQANVGYWRVSRLGSAQPQDPAQWRDDLVSARLPVISTGRPRIRKIQTNPLSRQGFRMNETVSLGALDTPVGRLLIGVTEIGIA